MFLPSFLDLFDILNTQFRRQLFPIEDLIVQNHLFKHGIFKIFPDVREIKI